MPVDANVGGVGTAKQFSLIRLLQNNVFPHIKKKYVGKNCPYEGYTVVYQEDNAGPHRSATYQQALQEECEKLGWYVRRQSPNSPQFNVLDLAVFPALSRRHSHYLRRRSSSVVPAHVIWNAADNCFKELENAAIARAFVLSFFMCKETIRYKGDNTYLSRGSLHFDIQRNYTNTAYGIYKNTLASK